MERPRICLVGVPLAGIPANLSGFIGRVVASILRDRLSVVSTHAFSIRRTVESDWRQIRDLRVEMIRDTPTAYAETLEEALGHDEVE